MNTIEEKALITFQKNMIYFSKNHINTYKKLYLFNEAIENSSYIEKYSLEYMNESYFDILEISTNRYMYNRNSNTHAIETANSVNYNKSDSAIQGFYIDTLSEDAVHKFNTEVDLNTRLFAGADIIYHYNMICSNKKKMSKIYKFIFDGVGLGLHIIQIQKKIAALQLYVIENNIELFRLSLFVTNYEELSKTTQLFFSIMETDAEFKTSSTKFIENLSTHNHYIKYTTLNTNDYINIKRFQSSMVTQNYLIHPYSKMLKGYIKGPEYLIDNYPFLNFSIVSSTDSPISNKPVLVIGSGPSLGYNLEWLKKNQNKFFLISAMSSLTILDSLDIIPDLTIHIDPNPKSLKILKNLDMSKFLNKTNFLFSSLVTQNVINMIPKNQLFFTETSVKYTVKHKILSAPSIGETSYAVALLLGAQEIYLLGLDLALDPDTKATHPKEHIYSRNVTDTDNSENSFILKDTIIDVKGNFLETVQTTSIYKISILAFNNISKNLLSTQKVYNLNNGAHLEGSKALKVKDINTDSLIKINNDKYQILHEYLTSISNKGMGKEDIINLNNQLNEALRLKNIIHKYTLSTTPKDFNTYLKKFYYLYQELLNFNENSKYDINKVFNAYLQYISGYIFDILNTKGVKNISQEIKYLDDILLKGIVRILNIYIKAMDVYTKWV